MTDIYDEIRYVPAMDYISRDDLQKLADAIRALGTEPVPQVHRQLLDHPPPSDGAIRAGQIEAAFKAAHPDCESEAWITGGYLTQMVCRLHRPATSPEPQFWYRPCGFTWSSGEAVPHTCSTETGPGRSGHSDHRCGCSATAPNDH